MAHAFSRHDLVHLLLTSQRHNRRHDITGSLMVAGGYFAQAIEGSPAAIGDLIERIRRDSRHAELAVLLDIPLGQRRYPDWSMGFLYSLDLVDELAAMHRFSGHLTLEGVQLVMRRMQADARMAPLDVT